MFFMLSMAIHNTVISVFCFLAIKSIKTIKNVTAKPLRPLSMFFMFSMAILSLLLDEAVGGGAAATPVAKG